jgi:hypothetical protein
LFHVIWYLLSKYLNKWLGIAKLPLQQTLGRGWQVLLSQALMGIIIELGAHYNMIGWDSAWVPSHNQ